MLGHTGIRSRPHAAMKQMPKYSNLYTDISVESSVYEGIGFERVCCVCFVIVRGTWLLFCVLYQYFPFFMIPDDVRLFDFNFSASLLL
jgi:hypothetical protein